MVITRDEKTKQRIVRVLSKNPEGLTVKALAEQLKLHRQTVTKYLLELKGAGIVVRKRVGSATLNYLKERFAQKVTEEKILEELRRRFR